MNLPVRSPSHPNLDRSTINPEHLPYSPPVHAALRQILADPPAGLHPFDFRAFGIVAPDDITEIRGALLAHGLYRLSGGVMIPTDRAARGPNGSHLPFHFTTEQRRVTAEQAVQRAIAINADGAHPFYVERLCQLDWFKEQEPTRGLDLTYALRPRLGDWSIADWLANILLGVDTSSDTVVFALVDAQMDLLSLLAAPPIEAVFHYHPQLARTGVPLSMIFSATDYAVAAPS